MSLVAVAGPLASTIEREARHVPSKLTIYAEHEYVAGFAGVCEKHGVVPTRPAMNSESLARVDFMPIQLVHRQTRVMRNSALVHRAGANSDHRLRIRASVATARSQLVPRQV